MLELESPEIWVSLFTRLHTLSIRQAFRFATVGKDSPPFLFPAPSRPAKLKELSFGPLPVTAIDQRLVLKSQFWLIENCPDLKRLLWRKENKHLEYFQSNRVGLPPMRRIAKLIELGQACQRLRDYCHSWILL